MIQRCSSSPTTLPMTRARKSSACTNSCSPCQTIPGPILQPACTTQRKPSGISAKSRCYLAPTDFMTPPIRPICRPSVFSPRKPLNLASTTTRWRTQLKPLPGISRQARPMTMLPTMAKIPLPNRSQWRRRQSIRTVGIATPTRTKPRTSRSPVHHCSAFRTQTLPFATT